MSGCQLVNFQFEFPETTDLCIFQAKWSVVASATVAASVTGLKAGREHNTQLLGADQPGAAGDHEQTAARDAGISQSMSWGEIFPR